MNKYSQLKLELEMAEFEDSGGLNIKASSVLRIGTPLMPYTEPSFANEGTTEQVVEEHVQDNANSKKRSRFEFEKNNSKPLFSPSDQLENIEPSSKTNSKLNKCALIKQSSANSAQSLS